MSRTGVPRSGPDKCCELRSNDQTAGADRYTAPVVVGTRLQTEVRHGRIRAAMPERGHCSFVIEKNSPLGNRNAGEGAASGARAKHANENAC